MPIPAIVPGLKGSGELHWQTWLEHVLPSSYRIEQPDWDAPDIDQWSVAISASLAKRSYPTTLIAHSFGCLAAVKSSVPGSLPITSALLVAPADPSHFGFSDTDLDFELPFRTTLVASRNDPWMTFDRARWWADRWASRLVDLGYAGHINVASGHGPWPQALSLISELNAGSALPFRRQIDMVRLETNR
jgi:predicted alpha/beta hydrolase family esterase